MARFITVGAAQMGPVSRNESRSAVVVRLLELMREARSRNCDLVVFTECALTPFFPRWWEDDVTACDEWFEREIPGPGTHLLFSEAQKLGIGFHLGFAELAEENGRFRHYNSSILVGPDGRLIGKYRKIHLPGQTQKDGENPHRCFEKRYFDVGNLGFRAWKAFGGAVGMCLGNDRRWPETYRVLGLQGAEVIILGYNTVSDHPEHPELDHLTNFHNLLSMQAGAYQNGCFVVGVAKAGDEEGINQIGRSAIIAPSGEVVTQCTTLGDELVVHRCNLDQARLYKDQIFNFAENRQIEAYSLITETRGPVPPSEPDTPEDGTEAASAAALASEMAQSIEETAPVPADKTESTVAETHSSRSPHRELPADPIQAIRQLFQDEYGYSADQTEPLAEAAARAQELTKSRESETPTAPKKEKPQAAPARKSAPSDILAKARAEAKPQAETEEASPAAGDVGWRPGRFPAGSEKTGDKAAEVTERLSKDYGYPDDAAQEVAQRAETAKNRIQKSEAPETEGPAPTAASVPGDQTESAPSSVGTKPAETKPAVSEKSLPPLSGKEAVDTFSLFTEKYGYASEAAQGIAERAYSAWQRWQTTSAEAKPKTEKAKPKAAGTKAAKPVSAEKPAAKTTAEEKAPEPATEAKSEEKAFVVVPCPECEFPLKISQENFGLLGRKARCPKCQTKFRLPESV